MLPWSERPPLSGREGIATGGDVPAVGGVAIEADPLAADGTEAPLAPFAAGVGTQRWRRVGHRPPVFIIHEQESTLGAEYVAPTSTAVGQG